MTAIIEPPRLTGGALALLALLAALLAVLIAFIVNVLGLAGALDCSELLPPSTGAANSIPALFGSFLPAMLLGVVALAVAAIMCVLNSQRILSALRALGWSSS